ncbi:MAG: hypothetical protein CL610_05230 [Anaerolineaceae bacterium]|nr:hypothetical protein [Anaerolineaceae bacterium]
MQLTKRHYYRMGGVLLLLVAGLFFVVMVRDLLRPPLTGTVMTVLNVNGQPLLHRLNLDNGELEPMDSDGIGAAHQPVFSPDYERVAFVAVEEIVNSEAVLRIYLSRIDDFDPQPITSGPRESDPQWSPDGSKIVFVRSRDFFSALFIVDVATGEEQQLTNFTNDLEPDWSPDSQRIVFTTSRDGFQELYTMAPDGSDLKRLTENENLNDLRAEYSPDGSMITYMTNYSVGDGTGEIWVMNADGSNQRRLTDNRRDDLLPVWSPDSRKIAFSAQLEDRSGSDIFVYDLDADTMQPLTREPGFEYFPAWSPDSSWMVYTAHVDGRDYTLNAVRVDGSDRRVLLTGFGAREAYWLPSE